MNSDGKYWLGFNIVKGVGPAKLRALLDSFGSVEAAWHADPQRLRQIGFDERTIENFEQTRARCDLDAEYERLEQAGARLLCWESADYPLALRDIPMSPPVLYVIGELREIDTWALALVGTRRLTAYGRQMARELAGDLARAGVTIVSGLARGIDTLAHHAAIDSGGRTIAVLGSGVDCIYPPENRGLAKVIAEGNGAIVSEYALGVQPEAKNFPPRNRIISGLSLGTLVIEAGERSGALITARFANEQGRSVYALPGPVTSRASAGCNRLIQQGAKLVTNAGDIIEDLRLERAVEQQAVQVMMPETAEEAALAPHLKRTPTHIDELSRNSGLPAALVSSTLTLMELKGMVQQVGGMQYVLLRDLYTSTSDQIDE